MGWRYPTSHTANTSQWNNPTNCYDGNLSTYGYDRIYPLPFTGYYIEFNIPEIQCNKIRFNAGNDNGKADKIDIDVYYDGSWHNVYYRGTFSSHVWVEVSFATHTVTKARVRFLTSQIWSGGQGWLYGFNFYEIVTETSWVNEHYAYDENTGSAATCITPSISWTPFLIYNLTPVYSALIKFIAKYDGGLGINTIDLDAYYDGSWHDIYSGSYLNGIWVEKALAEAKYISAIRVRFYNNGSSSATATLYELGATQSIGVPKVTTNAATDVADDLATLNGNITDTGGEVPTTRGFKYKEGIDGAETTTSESGYFAVGAYSKNLTGLDPTKKYYFRAYATNLTGGTGYGEWKSFGVDVDIPTVTSSAATSVDHEKAVLNGNITETGGEDPEERGFQYKIGAESTILTIRETGSFGVGAYSLDFDGLDPNIEYHFRAYAKNAGGTGYGAWLDLTIDPTDPMVRTHNATNELTTQVTGNGEIVSTGGVDCDERGFEYGLTKTATWKKNEVAGGYGVGFFALTIDGLTENTEYWYRAWAKHKAGEIYIYHLDADSKRIIKNYDTDGVLIRNWGEPTEVSNEYVRFMAVDASGNVYIGAGPNAAWFDWIFKYDAVGNLLLSLDLSGDTYKPRGMVVAPDGKLYTNTRPSTRQYLVQQRNLTDLTVDDEISLTAGNMYGGKIVFDSSGNFYTHSFINQRFERWTFVGGLQASYNITPIPTYLSWSFWETFATANSILSCFYRYWHGDDMVFTIPTAFGEAYTRHDPTDITTSAGVDSSLVDMTSIGNNFLLIGKNSDGNLIIQKCNSSITKVWTSIVGSYNVVDGHRDAIIATYPF